MLQPMLRDEVWMRQSMNTREGCKVLPASSDLHKSHGKTLSSKLGAGHIASS